MNRRERVEKKYCGQALITVLLVATICLIIVASLGLRTARRIIQSRQNREYQVAFGNANAGLQNAIKMIETGEYVNCISPAYCSNGEEYRFTIRYDDSIFVGIPKDRSIDIWLSEGNNASTLDLYCQAVTGANAGILATLIYYDQTLGYSINKFSLKCQKVGDPWNFGGSGGASACGNADYLCKKGLNIAPDTEHPGELKVVVIKALTTDSSTGASIEVKAIITDDSGETIGSTGGYIIDATGYGYGGVSSTLSVTVLPSGLPYPFDYVLFSGQGQD